MLDTFISGEGWSTIFKKITSSEDKKQSVCPICNKVFKTAKNLSLHREKFHTKKTKSHASSGFLMKWDDCWKYDLHSNLIKF